MSDGMRIPGGVLHVVAPAPFGGLESVVRALATAPRPPRPAGVAVLVQDGAPHPFAERLREEGVPVAEVRAGRRRYLAEARAVAALARTSGAAVLHAHNYHADLVGWLASRRGGMPIVSTVHGFSGGDFKNRAYEALDRRLLRAFNAVICVSEQTAGRVIRSGVAARRVRMIRNGYAAPAFAGRGEARSALDIPAGARVAGWVGRLSEAKGPDLMVEAAQRLGTLDPEAQVVVVGDGDQRDAMLARREALGVSPARLRLVGARDDAARLLPAFDALALSSRTEGTPMVLLEAMAAGVPVVSFAVGGVPDVLDDASAWLVTPGDTAAFAAALSAALSQPAEAARRAARARAILDERFGLAPWVAAVETVYREAGA